MKRYEKINLTLYGADLHSGRIDLKVNHLYSVFFIVENTSESEYIKDELLKFITASCEDFHFCGKYMELWSAALMELHKQVYPNSDKHISVQTYSDLNEMVNFLSVCAKGKYLVPTDFYLIYDDAVLYRKAVYSINFGFAQTGRAITCKDCYRFYDDFACYGMTEDDTYAEKCKGYIPVELCGGLIDRKQKNPSKPKCLEG